MKEKQEPGKIQPGRESFHGGKCEMCPYLRGTDRELKSHLRSKHPIGLAEKNPESSTSPSKISEEFAMPVISGKKKVRTIYDFCGADDDGLTFRAGETSIIVDDSDENWCRSSSQGGMILFPANFVATDLDGSEEDNGSRRNVSGFEDCTSSDLLNVAPPVTLF